MANDTPTPTAPDDEALTPDSETPQRESLVEQLKLITAKCFDENLAAYLAQHEEIVLNASQITSAVKALIRGEVIDKETLKTLREHASAFYEFVKANSDRTIVVKRNEGVRQAGRRIGDAIRAIMGKIDPITGMGAKLSELVPGFNLGEKLETRLRQIEEFGKLLGLDDTVIAGMKEEIMEMLREKCLPYTQGEDGYRKLKALAEEMRTIGATSLGIDISSILACRVVKYIDSANICIPIKNDLPEAVKAIAQHVLDDGNIYETMILLVAMRETIAPETVMRQIRLAGFGEKTGFEAMFKGKEAKPAIFFFYNADQKEGKSRKKMETLSQWLSMTFARIMNNREKEKNGEKIKPLHDNMSGWNTAEQLTDDEKKAKAAWFLNTHKISMPDFDDRDIVKL